LEIIYFKEIESTQKYLLNNLKPNICIWSDYQTNGIGSRGRDWQGIRGNLFFSFSLKKSDNVPLQSLSIYYMYQLKQLLNSYGSKVKFKWPNDLYFKNKVAGIITNLKNGIIIVGIGLNTKYSNGFDKLDVDIDNETILKDYFKLVSQNKSWNEVFEEYKNEFYQTKDEFNLSKAILNEDGSITINKERIYSLR